MTDDASTSQFLNFQSVQLGFASLVYSSRATLLQQWNLPRVIKILPCPYSASRGTYDEGLQSPHITSSSVSVCWLVGNFRRTFTAHHVDTDATVVQLNGLSYCGDNKAHRIRALALRVKSRLDRTRYRLLTRDWSMTQLLIGRTVEGRETRMHSSLVDSSPRRRDAR